MSAVSATSGMSSRAVANRLAAITRAFYHRGWVYGAGGCCSVVLGALDGAEPLRIAVTPAGVDRGAIRSEQILEVDEKGALCSGLGRVPPDIDVQLAVHQLRKARAVFHTSSLWSVLHADHARNGGITLAGYSILGSLAGRQGASSTAAEWLPVLSMEDRKAFLEELRRLLGRAPSLHGFLVRGCGLYSWGSDINEATRHSEVLEFLLEVSGRPLFGLGAQRDHTAQPDEDDDRPLYVAPRRGRAVAI